MEDDKQKQELNYEVFESKAKNEIEIGQVLFEEFIKQSINGIDIYTDVGEYLSKESFEIERELDLDTVDEVYYIENINAVKLILTNGCKYLYVRV